ncbi:hypothetical protein Cgig2_014986 [Carnegiea gigantea]|uniref:Uncharacterized protein n=1 Tax=Carnegiea gigantea TaxID=171969 RepID=A0A9Q1KLE4_9CARY|nr:hypothetical protein Cgig2_014986 [Carnegiea gigantea]
MKWCNTYEFVKDEYLAQGVSDHMPILLSLPNYPKPASTFRFCEMWGTDTLFLSIHNIKGASLEDIQQQLTQDPLNTQLQCLEEVARKEYLVVYGFKKVAKIMAEFYKNLLGKQDYTRSCVDPKVISARPVLATAQQWELSKPFTNSDIKQAMFSISISNSSGLDGFNSGFFKAS